jgi:phosphoglycerate kinase
VPLDESLNVTDATRIEAAKPTIDAILAQGGSVILMSHLGSQRCRKITPVAYFEDNSVLGVPVSFVSDCIGKEAENAAAEIKIRRVCYWRTFPQ